MDDEMGGVEEVGEGKKGEVGVFEGDFELLERERAVGRSSIEIKIA